MKTAVCYISYHHKNTLKVIQAMTDVQNADLIDILKNKNVDLNGYDVIGFASGIYGFDMHKSLIDFIKNNLPENKKVFFVYTYGLKSGVGAKSAADEAIKKNAVILGEYSCRGFDTFGPFKLVGGISKGCPTEDDLKKARDFYNTTVNKAD